MNDIEHKSQRMQQENMHSRESMHQQSKSNTKMYKRSLKIYFHPMAAFIKFGKEKMKKSSN